MTSTLDFYKLPINLYSKNFIMESLETYLGTLTPKTISSFQYQRFEMEKRIKVNISQDYQTYNGLTKYNYLRISQYNDNNALSVYYYFIKSAKQISESTIEFVIVMDVLNTFKYSTSVGQNNYNISEKSLITREHKDRINNHIDVITKAPIRKMMKVGLGRHEHYDLLNNTFIIDFSSDLWESNFLKSYSIGDLLDPTRATIINLKVVNKITGEVNTTGTIVGSVTFDYDEDDRLLDLSSPLGGSWGILIDEYYVEFTFTNLSENNTDLTIIDQMIDEIVFLQLINYGRLRIIDKYQEGIDSITFKFNESDLNDSYGNVQWYVSYSSQNAVTQNPSDTQALYVNPVQVDFISDDGYSLTSSSAKVVRIYPEGIPQFNNREEWLVIDMTQIEAGGYVEINGVQYTQSDFSTLYIEKKNNTDIEFHIVTDVLTPLGSGSIYFQNIRYVDVKGLNNCGLYTAINDGQYLTYKQDFYIGSGTSTETGTSPAFSSYDLTDPKLIKIIAFPYAPREDLAIYNFKNISDDLVWNSSKYTLELKKAQNSGFNRNIIFDGDNPLNNVYLTSSLTIAKNTARNIEFESKLFHSDFYLAKFVYDSFNFNFMLENLDTTEYNKLLNKDFSARYVCSGNLQSKFMFQFMQYICSRETQDYNNVLVISRNNEKAIFNNAYINYIRGGGYAFDQKSADTSKMVNALTIGLSTIGAVGSFLSTPVTGVKGIASGLALTLTTATKTINAIHQAQQNDRQIAQKLLSSSQQGTSVSASEDIDILMAYTNNKAKVCYYRISDELRNALWDLFHYFGYKCYEYKKPVTNTRCNFNFIQGEIILQDYTFNEDIANAIIEKYKEGVTFMHYDNSLGYDFKQEYENFETSLF